MRAAGVVRAVFLLAATSPAASGEMLRGRVFDSEGRPVAGAAISAFAERTPERRLLEETRGEKPRPAAETKTDEAGVFSLRLDRGTLEGAALRVDATGLPSLELQELDASDASEELQLVVDAPSAFSGRVVDEGGKAVAGARVSIADGSESGEGFQEAEARTGADGRFQISNAPRGEASIAVRADGFVPWTGQRHAREASRSIALVRGGALSGVVRDASGGPAAGEIVVCGEQAAETGAEGRYRLSAVATGRARVRVRSGRNAELAARADPRIEKGGEARADLRLERRASIAGTVVDQRSGKPVAGAKVTVSEADASALTLTEISARTDERGRFRIGGLAARPYPVAVVRRGYLPGDRAALASRDSDDSLIIPLRASGVVNGRVVDEKNAGIAGARVTRVFVPTIRALRDGSFSPARPTAFTRRDGTFRLLSVPPGATTLMASKDGYAPARRDGMDVAPGRPAPALTLVLRRGASARGIVVDAEGRPVRGAEVFVSPAPAAMGSLRFSSSWDSPEKPAAVTGPDGRFDAAGLPDGPLGARVQAAGFATRSFDSLEARVGGEPAEWKPFLLSRGAPVSGSVRNAKGEPIAGATLMAFGGTDKHAETSADADGRFVFDDWSAGDSLDLTASAPGYASHRQRVAAPADGVTIVLPAAATVRGRVEDAETKKAIEVFSVGYRVPRGTMFFSSQGAAQRFESPDGSFELTDVTPGRVAVTASAPGYLEGEVGNVELGEGETRENVVVPLRRGAVLNGRVIDGELREGVGGAIVTWARAGGEDAARMMWMTSDGGTSDSPQTATTDPDGAFHFDGVPREKLQIVARHADYLEAETTLDVAAASETELELSRGGTLAGTVLGADGGPVELASVSIETAGSARSEWSGDESPADASGRFSFEHLAEGRYRLTASGPSGRSEPLDVVLARGQRLDGLRLAIRGGAAIVGQVSGLPAERLGGLQVWANADGFSSDTKTDDGGAFRIRGAPAGVLSITVSTGASIQGRYVQKTVEVPSDAAELPVSIVFEGDSRLSGRVLRGDGGVSGAWVSVSPVPPGSGAASAGAMTDADGRYAAEGLSDGTYIVNVSAEGARTKRTVEISGDTTLDVVLGGGRLSGVVVDDETGDPIDRAVVQADSGNEDRVHRIPAARTDSAGAWEIVDVEPGDYRVTAARSGYASRTETATVGEDPTRLDLRLRKGGGLTIHASDAALGLPLRSVDVLAFAGDGTLAFHGSVPLDEAGRGEVPSLSGGTFALRLFASGYAPRAATASAPGPAVEAGLTPGGRVEVRAAGAISGQALVGDGSPYLASPWQIDGRLDVQPPLTVWDHVAPGAYRFVAGERSWSFSVEEGKTTTLELK